MNMHNFKTILRHVILNTCVKLHVIVVVRLQVYRVINKSW